MWSMEERNPRPSEVPMVGSHSAPSVKPTPTSSPSVSRLREFGECPERSCAFQFGPDVLDLRLCPR